MTKYQKLAIEIVEAMAKEYDAKGHPCCPICGNETCTDSEHEENCKWLEFLKLYRQK